jgi:hypothetical protein
MKFVFTTLLSLTFVSFANAGVSAVRHEGENFESARVRSVNAVQIESKLPLIQTPYDVRKSLSRLDISTIPEVASLEELTAQFVYIRDTRFMPSRMENFPRRMTWLYPDDGCFARAELVADFLVLQNFVAPKKVFGFGDLRAATNNSPYGSVSWWYHVAAIYRVGDTPYVMDPALMPERPMTLQEWNTAIGGNSTKVQYAICATNTFDPDYDCANPQPMTINHAQAEQAAYFNAEWNRLLQLKRNPEQELGDNPPWKKH